MWIHKIFRVGHSHAVVVPARLLKARGWSSGTQIVWSIEPDGRLSVEGLVAAVRRKAGDRGRQP